MAMNKEQLTERYLAEGLVALLPGCREEEGGTWVYTLQGAGGHRDPRSLPWLVEVLARFYRLDLAAVRRHTGRLLRLSHHIPLPLADGLVLLPVKVRQAAAPGESTIGYVNLPQVEGVEIVQEKREGCQDAAAGGPFPARSRIRCRGGLAIGCLNTAVTVRTKLRHGETARQELLQRQNLIAGPAALFPGLTENSLRELLPSCDCLLRSVFLLLLDASRPKSEQRHA